MKLVHYEDVKSEDVEQGSSKVKVRWLITKKTGADNFFMRLFEIEPEGFTPHHTHLWEHEIFILEGEGNIISEGKEIRFTAGDAIFIPSNEKHQFRNNSKKIVKMLCLIPNVE